MIPYDSIANKLALQPEQKRQLSTRPVINKDSASLISFVFPHYALPDESFTAPLTLLRGISPEKSGYILAFARNRTVTA